jgi:hypothetical protein
MIKKSLLTSLCQREEITPPHSSPYLRGGRVGLKRGKGRFFDECLFNYKNLDKRRKIWMLLNVSGRE